MLLVLTAMVISTVKSFTWTTLVGSIGGFSFFWLLVLDDGLPPFRWYFWPALSFLTGIGSTVLLKNAYRREPFQWKGWWQLGVLDLIIISIFTGALLALFSAAWPSTLIIAGIPISLITATMLTWGMLMGTRKGLKDTKYKALYGFGWTTWVYGVLGTGAFLILLISLFLIRGQRKFSRVLFQVLDFSESQMIRPDWFMYIFRVGIVCFPIGILCLWLSKRHLESRSKETEP